VHSSEGLNQQVYNRCVGTRYCANNCPYKTRRFNWFDYPHDDRFANLALNPDVAVRSRGVMEKCSYCIQRISEARIEAKKKMRDVQPGEVVTACQQVCPTKAIVFGDINNPQDPIHALRQSKLHYGIFEELATRPRTTYLARVRNPNTILEPAGTGGGHGGDSHGQAPAKAQEHS
jgi:molybdopterin-containing oxidoreductase family iron-sulfur binding subunit